METRAGRAYRGTLRSFDLHLNLVLEQAVELSTEGREIPRSMIAVRGDGILFLRIP